MARPVRNMKLSTGTRKMLWSITKRIGRRHAAATISASTKLTWLQTSTAAPSSGMLSSPLFSRRYTEWISSHTMKRIRNSGTSV
ncbi:hypothetical protein D3C83_58820 [compost metagenome]